MPPEQVAEALACHLFLWPPAVHAWVDYWLAHYTPLPTLQRPAHVEPGTLTAPQAARIALAQLVRRLVVARPTEFALRGQVATLPTADTLHLQSMYLLHALPPSDDWALAVPDYFLWGGSARAPLEPLRALIGAMVSEPDRYWAHVSHDGMRGHVAATVFRFPDTLCDAYCAELFVAHVYARLLAALVAGQGGLSPSGVAVHGPTYVQQLGTLLVEALDAAPACETPVLRALATLLTQCTDADGTARSVQQLAANLDTLALQQCEQRLRHTE